MKAAFISDIHGNAKALEAVLADIQKKRVDQIYVLGDICYRGPEPKRSLELIRSLETEVIKGNADEWVVRGVEKGEVPEQALEMMNRERDWTVSQLDRADLDYLDKLPLEMNLILDGISIHVFHATPESLFDIVLPGVDDELLKSKLMSSKDAQIYMYGHIHKPYVKYINGKIVMNTGSVGLPFDGLAMASYAIVEAADGSLTTSIDRVSYNIEKVAEQYRKANYPNADTMIKIIRNGSL
ncbi:metallophosphoesterase family protein [Paenibacillus sp. GP183]|uniref:metallophosphoesterase family protein n=1 Tax=Paenibacillus sp. GP183 TaxID=1882751 RepID=UPI0008948F13|nr:metallophosphoesterase family protein [Paenibacillus sp. GP183]SEC68193.1 phosphoesterase, MJ0936 family [Paenibacillus sp. GP183]